MLSYWMVRDPNGKPIGLARNENDRVTLHLNVPVSASWMLFSDTDAVPIEPDTETALPGANALLGTEDGRIIGFAAGTGARDAAVYRMRMSQICTKKESVPEPEPEPEPVEAEETATQVEPVLETVDDSAQRAAQFSTLLERADAFFARFDRPAVAPVDNMVQKEDNPPDAWNGGIDLFPQVFPRARWRYVQGGDVLAHYEGLMIDPNGVRTRILAVQGRAAPRPPRALVGFSRFLRGADGNGYWVRIMQT